MTQTAKLTASDGAADDYFGYSVSISGNTVVVGADSATVGGNAPGGGLRFTEPGSGWANMTQTAKLTASDGAAGDRFGCSVSISGNTVVVGADATAQHGGGLRVYRARLRLGEHESDRRTRPVWAVPRPALSAVRFRSMAIRWQSGRASATVSGNSGQGAAYVFGTPPPTVTSIAAAIGCPSGGKLVTIVGTNLSNATAVMFGTQAGTIMSSSATENHCQEPCGNGHGGRDGDRGGPRSSLSSGRPVHPIRPLASRLPRSMLICRHPRGRRRSARHPTP